MLHYIFTLFIALFFHTNIKSHTQAHFEHKKDFQKKEFPKLEEFTNTAHTPAPNIQDSIPNKTVFPEAPKLNNKPPIFVKNPHTGKIEPCIFVAHNKEELKKQVTEKYGPLTEEQYQLILAVFTPGILIPLGGTVSIPVGVAVGGGILIGWGIKEIIALIKEKKEKHNKDKSCGSNNSGNSGNNNNDKDPKDKKDKTPKPFVKKHPERTYEPNSNKHHPNAKNGIGKPSKNPIENLDKALNVPGEDFLITIEDDYFVMFREHLPGKYHDYIVENFKKLPQAARNALYNAGVVSDITKGKIK